VHTLSVRMLIVNIMQPDDAGSRNKVVHPRLV